MYMLHYDVTKKGVDTLSGELGDLWRTVFKHLKVDVNFTFYADRGYLDEDGKASGILADIFDNKMDVCLNQQLQRSFWQMQTYPHDVSGLCVMTRTKIEANPISVITSIFTLKACLALCLFLLTTIALLIFFLKIDFVQSFFCAFKMLLKYPELVELKNQVKT